MNIEHLNFWGETYDLRLDRERLTNNTQRVFRLMLDGMWHSPEDLQRVGGARWSARVRGLREEQMGSLNIETRRREDSPGVWEYRLDLSSLTRASYERIVAWNIPKPAPVVPTHRCCPVCRGTGKLSVQAAEEQMDLFGGGSSRV